MKGKIAALMAMSALSMAMNQNTDYRSSTNVSGNKFKPIPKGCKVFCIDGIKVIALNEKSAIKKIKARLKSSKQ